MKGDCSVEFAKDKEFVADFVLRTKQNIAQGHHPHEITQLINSLVGLLILPKERYYENIQNDMVERQLLEELRNCVKVPTKRYPHTLKFIVRRMRNALAHFHIECKVDKYTRQIDHIIFRDVNDGNDSGKPDFELEIHYTILEQFVYQFSDAVSKCIAASNNDSVQAHSSE